MVWAPCLLPSTICARSLASSLQSLGKSAVSSGTLKTGSTALRTPTGVVAYGVVQLVSSQPDHASLFPHARAIGADSLLLMIHWCSGVCCGLLAMPTGRRPTHSSTRAARVRGRWQLEPYLRSGSCVGARVATCSSRVGCWSPAWSCSGRRLQASCSSRTRARPRERALQPRSRLLLLPLRAHQRKLDRQSYNGADVRKPIRPDRAREAEKQKQSKLIDHRAYSTAGATSPTQAQERGERRERAIVGALCLALLVPPSGRAGVRARHCARGPHDRS